MRRWFGFCSTALLAALASGAAAQDPGQDQLFVTRIRGDWLYGCNNHAQCTMVGFANLADPNKVVPDNSRSLAIRLHINQAQAGSMTMEMIPDGGLTNSVVDGIDWGGRFLLSVPTLRGRPIYVGFVRSTLPYDERAAIVAALMRGEALSASDAASGSARINFAQSGFAEAYRAVLTRQRWIRRWQARNPPYRQPVSVQRGHPALVSGVPPVTAAMMDWCGAGVDAAHLRQFSMPAGITLWQHHCPADGINLLSRWYVLAVGSSSPRPADLPDEGGATSLVRRIYVPNATYDFDFGVLRSYRFDSHFEDIGVMMVWAWSEGRFVLIERREMPICCGLLSADWIQTFRREIVLEDS